jgi:hypothetical protein
MDRQLIEEKLESLRQCLSRIEDKCPVNVAELIFLTLQGRFLGHCLKMSKLNASTRLNDGGIKPKRSKYGYGSYQYEYKKDEKGNA